ncbi:hypothetical protein ACFLUG_03455 [Chloroflexota bacterium]
MAALFVRAEARNRKVLLTVLPDGVNVRVAAVCGVVSKVVALEVVLAST